MQRGKLLKRIGLGALILLTLLAIIYWDLIVYGIRQANGQLYIVRNAKPVEEYLNDATFPDSLKAKLRLIQEVRTFAIDSLGLNDTDNYKTLYDQKGEEVLWVVTASEPFELKAKEWNFPVLGSVPYKGFFNKNLAIKEKEKLDQLGFDTSVRNPGAWSTLGWFTDPILSKMLERTDGDLASLIIHEMVHATIFVKDSVEFNENLASFIGDRGAERFLLSVYGKESKAYRNFVRENIEYNLYVEHVLRACNYLDSVYASIQSLPVDQKLAIKNESIREIILATDTIEFKILENPSVRYLDRLPNNAYFLSFRRYQSKQDVFWILLNEDFKSDLPELIRFLKRKHPFL